MGCRALTKEELEKIDAVFDSHIGSDDGDNYDLWTRDKTIFHLQRHTGFRISELISIRLKQVLEDDDIGFAISVPRSYMKGGKISGTKTTSRTVKLNDNSRDLIRNYLEHYKMFEESGETFLFRAWHRKKDEERPNINLSDRSCSKIYKDLFKEAKIPEHSIRGRLSTHSLRKTFCRKAQKLVGGDIKSLMEMMGHRSMESTGHYIEADEELIDNAWKKM